MFNILILMILFFCSFIYRHLIILLIIIIHVVYVIVSFLLFEPLDYGNLIFCVSNRLFCGYSFTTKLAVNVFSIFHSQLLYNKNMSYFKIVANVSVVYFVFINPCLIRESSSINLFKKLL